VTRGGDPERIRESQRRRGASAEVVDQVIALFEEHQSAQYAVTQTRFDINVAQDKIRKKREDKEDATELLQSKRALGDTKKEKEIIARAKHAELLALARTVGNYVDDSVPFFQDESHNP
jgi:seryl-tRNA synthetase